MAMGCGCIVYPCMHTHGGMGQAQMQQSLYYEMLRQSGLQNMQSMQQAATTTEKKPNKKLLLLRK